MPTSPTDLLPEGARLLVFVEDWRWLALGADGVAARGTADDLPVGPASLAVPGGDVAIHWLDLAEGLAPAQAAAAARLMLADASAEPLDDLHVAVGRAEAGLTPVALVPNAKMTEWLAAAEAAGLDVDAMTPTSLLLLAPETGFARRGLDHRGIAAAFALEPELTAVLTGDQPVEEIGDARFEAALPILLDALPIDLRQGPFARRRRLRIDAGWGRRVALFALAALALTLLIQVTLILRYTFAAERLETELAALETGQGPAPAPGFGPVASRLFEAVRATPNVQLARIEYRPDGSLAASLTADSPATIAAFRARAEAGGLSVEGATAAGPSAEITVRAS